jgi:hypothetical protein
MSTDPFNFEAPSGSTTAPAGGGAGAQPAQAPPPGRRHAFGLPAGSIRAILAFIVLGLIWALMYFERGIPLYLQYLMFLILGHYFAAHHKTIKPYERNEFSPLFMPRGFIRTLIFLGFVGVIIAIFFQHRDNMQDWARDLKMQTDRTASIYMPLLLVVGFLFGLIVARIGWLLGGKAGQPGWYQDIQAWLALLSALGLAGVVIVHLVINPSLETSGKALIKLPHLEVFLAPIVGFYFGARS